MVESILTILERCPQRWVSLGTLQDRCGLPPAQVARQLARLDQVGFRVQQDARRGVRLGPHAEGLPAKAIEHELGTTRVGRHVLVFQEVSSTNDVAWQVARQPDCDGMAIFAESQRAGRGRMGTRWFSGNRQSLLLSIVLVGADNEVYYRRLNLIAAVALVDAVCTLTHLEPRIKWPNDVLIGDRKVAGALIETRSVARLPVGVLGVGVNCLQERTDFPPELRSTAASLKMMGAGSVDRLLLARCLLRQLDQWLEVVEAGDDQLLAKAWRLHAAPLPEQITVARNGQTFQGRTVAIDPLDGLVLQLRSGNRVTFDARNARIVR